MSQNLDIARTISKQIRTALFMINAKDLLAVEKGLSFRVSCRGTKCSHITITLDPNDTYTFVAKKVTGGRFNSKTLTHSPLKTQTVLEASDVYCDMLPGMIQKATGLAVSL